MFFSVDTLLREFGDNCSAGIAVGRSDNEPVTTSLLHV